MDVLIKRICETCALALLLLVFVPAAPAAGQASSKRAEGTAAVHPWTSFGPGSWVEIKSTTVKEAAGKRDTSIIGTKITLLEKSADKVTLENELTMNGQTMKSKFDMPLKDYSDALPEGMKVLSTGSDTLTIAGKSVHCETMEITMNEDAESLFKRWTSGEVPGSLVRSVSSSKGSRTTTEVVGFKAY